eukprot:TRINITY_DN2172_c0_g1_i1.p1 TRINITY_DN2172_c0_g1~~TRINITY_DN2172_c0_g1_i1.p1  ORF type:complete len:312 (+),score=76.53 TRINITY_DN2172_c0_g1_i1:98-1033(+)
MSVEVSVMCNSSVTGGELESLLRLPGFVGVDMDDPEDEAEEILWIASFENEEAATAAVFALNGQKSKEGHKLIAARRQEAPESDDDVPQWVEPDVGPTDTKDITADWQAFYGKAKQEIENDQKKTSPDKSKSALDSDVTVSETAPIIKRRKLIPRDCVPSWLQHIPPVPYEVRSPKMYIPAVIDLVGLRDLHNGTRAYHLKLDGGYSTDTVLIDESTGLELPPPEPPTSIAITWEAEKPNISNIKKALLRKVPLTRCTVSVPTKTAVLSFKTKNHIDTATGIMKSKGFKAIPLTAAEVPTFLENRKAGVEA